MTHSALIVLGFELLVLYQSRSGKRGAIGCFVAWEVWVWAWVWGGEGAV